MTKIKICGIRQLEHALAAADAGADMLGFVFAPSRRRIDPDTACEITRSVREQYPGVRTVGLFVNEHPEEIARIVSLCHLDLVQLSGDESNAMAEALQIPVIRTVHIFPGGTEADTLRCIDSTAGEIVLLDTGAVGSRGGTGIQFEWSVVPTTQRPILLAGGLNVGNVGAAIQTVRPWGVDVSSGVETDGMKDSLLIREFVLTASKLYAV